MAVLSKLHSSSAWKRLGGLSSQRKLSAEPPRSDATAIWAAIGFFTATNSPSQFQWPTKYVKDSSPEFSPGGELGADDWASAAQERNSEANRTVNAVRSFQFLRKTPPFCVPITLMPPFTTTRIHNLGYGD